MPGSITRPYFIEGIQLDGKSLGDSLELGRASINTLIPKSKSLDNILKEYFPDQKDNILTMSFRTPTSVVANATLNLILRETINKQLLKITLSRWYDTLWPDIGFYSRERCISMDFLGTSYSFIIDDRWIECAGKHARISLWYDNEWGYASLIYKCLKDIYRQGSQ